MQHAWLDFSGIAFWLVWFLAWLSLNIAPSYFWHQRIRYGVNALVLFYLLGFKATALLLICIYCFYGVCHFLSNIQSTNQDLSQTYISKKSIFHQISLIWYYIGFIGILLLLFTIHKGILVPPNLTWFEAQWLPDQILKATLATVGFSYVMLRSIDLIHSSSQTTLKVDFWDMVNYVLPFHMLTAGPIQSFKAYKQAEQALQKQFNSHTNNSHYTFYTHPHTQRYMQGLQRIAQGLFKKYVIAASIQSIFLQNFTHQGFWFFIEIQMFYVWLYFDFSAYSDLAVGIGKTLNISTPENFNHPLKARNLTDFWERWHISLSQWIKVHLYLPLNLAFVRRTRNAYPLMGATLAFSCAFVLCGIWHELSWRFFMWGAFHALGLSVCNAYRTWLMRTYGGKWVRQVYMHKKWVRYLGQALTFECVALSLLFAFYPH